MFRKRGKEEASVEANRLLRRRLPVRKVAQLQQVANEIFRVQRCAEADRMTVTFFTR